MVPALIPSRLAIGPLTSISGASGTVDTCISRKMQSGSASASTAAMRTGRCSGRHPAITAFTASFSTLAIPKPGSMMDTTSWGSRLVPPSIRSTASGVGGTTGKPSPQPLSRNRLLTASTVDRKSSPPTVTDPQRAVRARGRGRLPDGVEQPADYAVDLLVDHAANQVVVLARHRRGGW